MHNIFLSYSFQNERDPLLLAVRSIIDCAGFNVIDGKVLDGSIVTTEVRDKLQSCKGVVCVVTPEAIATGWVIAELFQAFGYGIDRLFILCQNDIDLGNPALGFCITRYTGNDSLSAIASLANTMGSWSFEMGKQVQAVILPEEIGARAHENNATCKYRCESAASFEESEWQTARLKPVQGTIYAILPEVPFEHTVQIKVEFAREIWESSFIPQHLNFDLSR